MATAAEQTPAAAPNDVAGRAVEAVGVTHSFGGVQALRNASFAADFGEVHALVGENGAGKSTMIKILCGVLRPDEGIIRLKGEEVRLLSPKRGRELGVATVFQELTLLPFLTVAENLLLANEPRGRLRLVRRRELWPAAAAVLERYGVDGVDPRELAGRLPLALQQRIEVVRALLEEPDVLFLDEPTSTLAEREVQWLFALVRELRDANTCVIFTSHRWREIERIADRITVFRSGEHVATRVSATEDEAVTLMTGRTIERIYPHRAPAPSGDAALEVDGLVAAGVHGCSFGVRAGEILGIGGLAGQGQRELFMTIFGAQRAKQGTITVGGRLRRIRNPSDAIKAGIGISLVPEDRKSEGLLLPMSVRDNLTLAVLDRFSTAGFLRPKPERAAVREVLGQLQIKTHRPQTQEVGKLSGGNQQKVLIARSMLATPTVLLLYDITRGVDIGTKHDLYELIAKLAADGKAVVFYSSETEEMAHLCHRVLVMREGRPRAELDGEGLDAEAIVAAAIKEHDDDGG
jgi:ribose transport system ATP-binding protein